METLNFREGCSVKLGAIIAAAAIALTAAGCENSSLGDAAGHDWDHQYRETAWVWNDLHLKGVNFERPYKLDLQFVPRVPSADHEGFAEALRAAGYEVRFYEDDLTVQATTSAMKLTPESIWTHERPTTKTALSYGFRPDGWRFLED